MLAKVYGVHVPFRQSIEEVRLLPRVVALCAVHSFPTVFVMARTQVYCVAGVQTILSKFQRGGGLKSSMVGLETIMGKDMEIGFEDYLGGTGFVS